MGQIMVPSGVRLLEILFRLTLCLQVQLVKALNPVSAIAPRIFVAAWIVGDLIFEFSYNERSPEALDVLASQTFVRLSICLASS